MMNKLNSISLLMLLLIDLLCSIATADQVSFMRFISGDKDPNILDSEYKNLYNLFLCNLKSSNSPEIIILSGTPGAGKSTFRKKYLGTIKNFYLHDPDEVTLNLKGYEIDAKKYSGTGAFDKWWPIVHKVVNQLTQYAFKQNFNIIYDRALCTQKSFDNLQYAILQKNYKAKMYAFHVTEAIALDRVKKRALKDNRADIPKIVKQCGRHFSTMFTEYIKILPVVILYCNGKVCFKKENGVIDIIDAEAYKEFLDYGGQLQN